MNGFPEDCQNEFEHQSHRVFYKLNIKNIEKTDGIIININLFNGEKEGCYDTVLFLFIVEENLITLDNNIDGNDPNTPYGYNFIREEYTNRVLQYFQIVYTFNEHFSGQTTKGMCYAIRTRGRCENFPVLDNSKNKCLECRNPNCYSAIIGCIQVDQGYYKLHIEYIEENYGV